MKSKKKEDKYRTCADCIHEWACQAWNVGTIHEMDAGICANYEAVKDSTVYWLGYRAGQADGVYVLNKAIDLMAEYIVTLGRVDYFLCDLIPKETIRAIEKICKTSLFIKHSVAQSIIRKN